MEPLFFADQLEFRKWLKKNHKKENELWVGYYKKKTGIPSMTWSESVDQALCYGWIDGIRKSIDEKAYKIRFTPRKVNSIWSAVNLKKIEELKAKKLIAPAGLEIFENRNLKKQEIYAYELQNTKLPKEYLSKIKKNKKAWEYWQKMPPGYKKQTIYYILGAKQESTRLRRLDITIASCTEGKKIPLMRRN